MTTAFRWQSIRALVTSYLTSRPVIGQVTNDWRGFVDVPTEGQVLDSRLPLTVAGWHTCRGHEQVLVTASIDRKLVGVGYTGRVQRPDVADVYNDPELLMSGWTFLVDLNGLSGQQKLEIALHSADGTAYMIVDSRTIEVADLSELDITDLQLRTGTVSGFLDNPDIATELERGAVLFSGWALCEDDPVDEVVLYVNAIDYGCCRLGIMRPDLKELSPPYGILSGFERLADLSGLDEDVQSVDIVASARTRSGKFFQIDWRSYPLLPRNTPVEVLTDISHVATVRPENKSLGAVSKAPFNLLVFTHDLGLGGGQLWLQELLERSGAGQDFSCTVVSPRSGPLLAQLTSLGIDVHVMGETPVSDHLAYEGRLFELFLWIKQKSFDAVLINTFLSFLGADATGRLGLPYVWAIHESWPIELIWSAAYPPKGVALEVKTSVQLALRKANTVIFEAEATRRQYLPTVTRRAAQVVTYGVNTGEILRYCKDTSKLQARRLAGIREDVGILLMLGTIEPRKAQGLIVRAFSEILTTRESVDLVMVGGSNTPYVHALESFVDDANLGGRVRIEAVTTDIYKWYRLADLFICASDVESLPRSVLEAMCFGVPVLATEVYGLPELITDMQTGFLYKPNSLSGAVDALNRVLDLESLELAEIAAAGQKLVIEEYDSQRYSTRICKLLKDLASQPDADPGTLLEINNL